MDFRFVGIMRAQKILAPKLVKGEGVHCLGGHRGKIWWQLPSVDACLKTNLGTLPKVPEEKCTLSW